MDRVWAKESNPSALSSHDPPALVQVQVQVLEFRGLAELIASVPQLFPGWDEMGPGCLRLLAPDAAGVAPQPMTQRMKAASLLGSRCTSLPYRRYRYHVQSGRR